MAQGAALGFIASTLQGLQPTTLMTPDKPPKPPLQRQVLEVLREVRAAGEKLLPDMDKSALGGLTTQERNEVLGVYPDGEHIGNTATHICRHIPGASVRTLRALVACGHARCESGVFIAQVRSTRPTD